MKISPISYLNSLLFTLNSNQKERLRGVKSPEGQVSLDFRGKLPGRGAYVCPDPACLAKARKSRALERAFSAPLPPEVWEALEEQMKEVPTDAQ